MSSKRTRTVYENENVSPPQHAPYALYGTALPVYDSQERDDGSYVPIWKQEVTDERGRKRLHGAFTGGFSAGYFNSVGSKEGWTPSTFVSSRTNRAKDQKDGVQQRAEDFMDDEDLAEQAESRKLETKGGFSGLGGTREDRSREGMFSDLFRTVGETMGVKLLQKMGWRLGQGIGPKIKRNAKGDKTGEAHWFAPDDSPMISFEKKTDRKGLGFAGGNSLASEPNHPESAGEDEDRDASILQSHRTKLTSKSKKTKKTGFGVGVLNDNGSDDEDPYAMGPQINYNRIVVADRRKKKGGLFATTASLASPKPMYKSTKLAEPPSHSVDLLGLRKCPDDRLPLDGFVLSTTPLTTRQGSMYPPPSVPEGWVSSKIPGKPHEAPFRSTADAARSSQLNPASRAALLHERPLPGKSIFDFLSPAARDRVASASGRTDLPPALGESAPPGFETSESDRRRTLWDLIPQLNKQTAVAALARATSGWMPYAEDEAKRSRYRYFLELRAGLQNTIPSRATTHSVDAWAKELAEFAHAAEVFKPISGLMASRFTSSSSTPQVASDAPDPLAREAPKQENPAEKAAKMGMYGPLTRSTQAFYPTRLLCKRFNVKPPTPASDDRGHDAGDGNASAEEQRLEVVSQASLNRMMKEVNPAFSAGAGFVSAGLEGGQHTDLLGEKQASTAVDAEKNDALEGQKAGEAIFKAIFGSDDEEE